MNLSPYLMAEALEVRGELLRNIILNLIRDAKDQRATQVVAGHRI